ncbi:MAG: Rrf2 family transcriptional regulator [Cyanobacteriota bacterium]|nr:Rrf2 family transcriptional regulator [Cyanobacteriota bacterium]
MVFSAKTDYGLIALMDLAEARGSDQLLQTREISARHAIPERYLEQTLTALRKAGYLRSLRGPRGGFQLRLPPEEIRIGDVVACLEGERRPEPGRERDTPEFQAVAALERRSDAAMAEVLARLTLRDLLRERDGLRQSQPMFFI